MGADWCRRDVANMKEITLKNLSFVFQTSHLSTMLPYLTQTRDMNGELRTSPKV